MKKKIVLLQHYFNEIGGIETFLINFCKVFHKDYDIKLVCRSIGINNALILSDYVDVICEPIEEITCDICIVTSVLVDEKTFPFIKYKKLFHMIHSDWTEMKKFWNWEFKSYDKNTKYISVSETAQKSFIREYNHDSVVIPNILTEIKPKKILRLISATRLTTEKGYGRMVQLCKLFEKYNIPYEWTVYATNPYRVEPYGNMVIKKPIQGISELFTNYDYVVQLSDTESYCYTMYEALIQGVPVLLTPFPNAIEEIDDGENGYLLPFDMNLTKDNIEYIYNNIPKVSSKYKQKGIKELWENILK